MDGAGRLEADSALGAVAALPNENPVNAFGASALGASVSAAGASFGVGASLALALKENPPKAGLAEVSGLGASAAGFANEKPDDGGAGSGLSAAFAPNENPPNGEAVAGLGSDVDAPDVASGAAPNENPVPLLALGAPNVNAGLSLGAAGVAEDAPKENGLDVLAAGAGAGAAAEPNENDGVDDGAGAEGAA